MYKLQNSLWVLLVATLLQSTLFAVDFQIPPFEAFASTVWKAEDNKNVILADYKGNMILAMAYTSCKFTCPLTIRKIKSIYGDANKQAQQVVIITLDPEIDTPENLLHYKKRNALGSNWHFLSGSLKQTKEFADKIGLKYENLDGHISHDNIILTFDANRNLIKRYLNWDQLSASEK